MLPRDRTLVSAWVSASGGYPHRSHLINATHSDATTSALPYGLDVHKGLEHPERRPG